MSKLKSFLEDFKIIKSLGSYKADLKKGEQLTMFNNTYQIVSEGHSQVLLKDNRDITIAIPRNKLQLLMKNKVAQRLAKAAPVPVGSMSPDGQYVKTSDNPPKWKPAPQGKGKDGESAKPEAKQAKQQDSEHVIAQNATKIYSQLASHVHAGDSEKLKELALNYAKTRKDKIDQHAAIKEARKDKQTGQAAQPATSQFAEAFKIIDKHVKAKKELVDFVKESKKKSMGAK